MMQGLFELAAKSYHGGNSSKRTRLTGTIDMEETRLHSAAAAARVCTLLPTACFLKGTCFLGQLQFLLPICMCACLQAIRFVQQLCNVLTDVDLYLPAGWHRQVWPLKLKCHCVSATAAVDSHYTVSIVHAWTCSNSNLSSGWRVLRSSSSAFL